MRPLRPHHPSVLSLAAGALLLAAAAGPACKGADEGRAAAEREAREEAERLAKAPPTVQKLRPPVPGMTKIPCSQLVDADAFTKALGEVEPLTVVDKSKVITDAAASCSLVRGGKPLSAAEQAAKLKKGRLGVLPGDEVCNVTAYCWTIEDADAFKAKCKEKKLQDDESMGSYACVQVVITGEFDVKNFKFIDPDTKCMFEVRGGPGMTDNDFIATCAKTARDLIGPAQIAVGGAPAGGGDAPAAGSDAPAAK